MEKERATAWTGVPTMIQDLMEHPDFSKYDLSSLRVIGSGGAPNPTAQVAKSEATFKVARPAQGYGLTETNGAVATISAENYLLRPSSTGQPFPIVEVKIVDLDTGKEVPVGQAGELLVRSPLVMKEYWNKPKATQEVLLPGYWFRTGDVARLDTEGYIYITDRAKDIIIRGGENISCAEVESAIWKQNPDLVMECAVFGIPCERLGEEAGALIMVKKGAKGDAKQIVQSLKKELAGFKIPKPEHVFFTEEPLPRGPTGKTLKRVIRDDVSQKLGKVKSKL